MKNLNVVENFESVYNNAKVQLVNVITEYLSKRNGIMFFKENTKLSDGNTYLSLFLDNDNRVIVTFIPNNDSVRQKQYINDFELKSLLDFPILFNNTESKFSWVCEYEGEYIERHPIGFNSSEEAYQEMVDSAFSYARSLVADKEKYEGLKFDISVKFDNNVVNVNGFKYYIYVTE